MKPIKYLLLFATALCVSQWRRWGREPQRGFGPRFSRHPREERANSYFEPQQKQFETFNVQQDQDTYFQPQQQDNNFQPQQNQDTFQLESQTEYFQPQQFQGFQGMDYQGPVQPLKIPEQQLSEQQLETIFRPLYEQLLKIEHKLNNNEQLTEQQIFGLLLLMPDLVELQPLFEQFSQLSQNPQDVQKQQVQQAFQQLKEVQSQVGESL